MACGCGGSCVGCLGSYREAPPLAWAGWRLRVQGNPPGGQYHGYLGALPNDFANPGSYEGKTYRAPGETPPQITAGGPTVRVPHSRRQAGFSIVPGAYKALGAVALPYPNSNLRLMPWGSDPIVTGTFSASGGATSATPQPPPPYACPTQPYNTTPAQPLPPEFAPQPQPSPIVAAPTGATPGAGQSSCVVGASNASGNCVSAPPSVGTGLSWFTDSAQEVIKGIPNWGLVAAVLGAFMLTRGRR